MIKAIVFDFDGVIVDTESKRFADLVQILKNTPYELNPNQFKKSLGKKTTFFLKEEFPEISEKELNKIILSRRKLQYEKIEEYKLILGIRELLKSIKSQHILIGLATGSKKDFVNKVLEFNSLSKFFDVYVCGEDFHRSKPDSECYEVVLKKLNMSASDILVIEDSIAGVKSAKTLGCKVIGITTSEAKENLFEADKVFSNHLEIKEYLI